MLRSIMEGRYEFVSPEWDEISDKAKDMVRGDLCAACEGDETKGECVRLFVF